MLKSSSKSLRPQVAHVTTSALSAILMRGQLAYLTSHGFDVMMISSPGPQMEAMRTEGAEIQNVAMNREITPFADLLALYRLVRILRRWKPSIANFSTPKAGLLGAIASTIARVPHRVYTLRGLRFETAFGKKRLLLVTIERLICSLSHRVICVSSSVRDRAIELRILGPEKATLLANGSSNGVDSTAFERNPDR
ncbi:MAG: glycosyltransferase, partial [Terriglobales bacterium]